uniref:Dynein light chain n=2 Tax=Panagrolaimus TaxID=55784 RepID=A0A914P5P6_9BILA
MANQKVITTVKKSTMTKEMELSALLSAVKALKKHNIEKDAARVIKQDFDKTYGGQWHCVVGRQFGCYVSHYQREFIYFYANSVAVMLFRTADDPGLDFGESLD